MENKKLAIIVPYRDRLHQLEIFLTEMEYYLSKTNIPYIIYVIQQDNANLFNRGMLLNIGYKYAKKDECDYMVFHDVDMLPLEVNYEYSEIPLHMATDFINDDKTMFPQYFGGVTMFSMEAFEKINGFSNNYWGWGYEDTDLLYRCVENDISLDTMNYKNSLVSEQQLKFNGNDAYVEGKNIFNFKKPITFHISFQPNNIICDHKKVRDDFTIFSIPGWDFSISFNSFSRYNVCLFNKNYDCLYVNSNIKPNYYTTISVTINPKKELIKIYQDGDLMETISEFGKLYSYEKSEKFYIGASINENKLENFFAGLFDKFIVYNSDLNEVDVKKLYNFDIDNIENDVVLYYNSDFIEDYKLVDLSRNSNDGQIVNCEIVNELIEANKKIKIPRRRKSKFFSLKHDENGFLNGQWKDQNTRWNQMRFYNETLVNKNLIKENGLSNLKFTEHGIEKRNKIKIINVGI